MNRPCGTCDKTEVCKYFSELNEYADQINTDNMPSYMKVEVKCDFYSKSITIKDIQGELVREGMFAVKPYTPNDYPIRPGEVTYSTSES